MINLTTNITTDNSYRLIGQGVDGKVYATHNNAHCIKVSLLRDTRDGNLLLKFNNIKLNIQHIIQNNPQPFVRTFNFSTINTSSQGIRYTYTMDMCEAISSDEERLFHTLVSHEDNNKVKDLSHKRVSMVVKELAPYLDFDERKVMLFCKQLRSCKLIKHLDIHPRNIMIGSDGYFKLTDLDRLQMENTI